MQYNFKVGDVVQNILDADIGIIKEHITGKFWRILYVEYGLAICSEDYNIVIEDKDNLNEEQQAVMLLLSLGYTISKN